MSDKQSGSSSFPQLPLAAGTGNPTVPVYDCRVFVANSEDGRGVVIRCVNTPDLVVNAGNERDGLREMVKQFRAMAERLRAAGEPVPVADPAARPEPGEQERWIPVHL